MRITLPVLVLAIAALTACTPGVDTAATPAPISAQDMAFVEAAVTDTMRDPASAQFRRWAGYALANGDSVACGEVNGRNGFGGYVGFAPFYVRYAGSTLKRMHVDDGTGYGPAGIGCGEAARGVVQVSD
ncbi:MAG: hypothetical protein GW886_14815 [Rhodobacterales bacterium]|nr:hypothetical protein [Rhodobacterales bacterium]NCT12298.1 hypothetical protein [Rhodobacterales bacterium]